MNLPYILSSPSSGIVGNFQLNKTNNFCGLCHSDKVLETSDEVEPTHKWKFSHIYMFLG